MAENGIEEVQPEQQLSYEDKIKGCNQIAQPLATKSLMKKICKLVKKASKHDKSHYWAGLKDVQKAFRKGETGIVFIAGDVTPIEIIAHFPVLCEDRNIPYCFVPTKFDLTAPLGVKRSILCMLVKPHPDYAEAFEDVKEQIKYLPSPL